MLKKAAIRSYDFNESSGIYMVVWRHDVLLLGTVGFPCVSSLVAKLMLLRWGGLRSAIGEEAKD